MDRGSRLEETQKLLFGGSAQKPFVSIAYIERGFDLGSTLPTKRAAGRAGAYSAA